MNHGRVAATDTLGDWIRLVELILAKHCLIYPALSYISQRYTAKDFNRLCFPIRKIKAPQKVTATAFGLKPCGRLAMML